MNRTLQIACGLLCFTITLLAGEPLDRVVASVNGHALLASDQRTQVRIEQLMAGAVPVEPDANQGRAALDHLIDQRLLQQEMEISLFAQGTSQDIEPQLQDLRARLGAQDEKSWKALLARYDVSEADVREQVLTQSNTL